jgi:hypothetical protein
MRTKVYNLISIALCAFVALTIVQSPTARAVPSYARQTGLACAACHTVYPALTRFGRLFKLNGYTMTNLKQVEEMPTQTMPALSLNQAFPLSVMLQADSTSTNQPQPGVENPHVGFPDQLSLFLAGAITPHIGTFMQVTYTQADASFGLDLTDIRYANQATLGSKPLIWGFTLNNAPSVEDLWNSTPTWGFPFFSSETAEGPAAGPFIASDAIQTNSVGVGPYMMYDEHLYGTFSFYRTAPQGNDPGDLNAGTLQGADPYWRLAWNQDGANYSWEVGTFGFDADYRPDIGTLTNKYTDVGADGQYQYFMGPHIFEMRGDYIHESQTLDADVVNGAASVRSNDLNFVNFNGDWYYQRWVGLSLGYFRTWGGNDCTIYASCSPDSDGEVFEVDYLPWENIKLMAQYTAYNKFDGIASNASDFNTLILHLNLAF